MQIIFILIYASHKSKNTLSNIKLFYLFVLVKVTNLDILIKILTFTYNSSYLIFYFH